MSNLQNTLTEISSRTSYPALERAHLFVVRVWLAELGEGKREWRGEVQYASSRERRYFREWSVLLDFLSAQLQAVQPDDSTHGGQHE